MQNELLNQLASGVISCLSIIIQVAILVIVPFIFKFLKAKFGETVTKTIVSSIQQTMGFGNGGIKKKIAGDLLAKKLGWFFSTTDIDHLIEATVFGLNQSLNNQISQASDTTGKSGNIYGESTSNVDTVDIGSGQTESVNQITTGP
jgi:uncharacterized membrane protein required for colicin V production